MKLDAAHPPLVLSPPAWRRSLRAKLVGLVLVTTLLALAIALGAMAALDLRAYHRGLVADLQTQAELLGLTCAPALAFDDARVADENLRPLRLRPQMQAAAVYDARGKLFATFASNAAQQQFPRNVPAEGARVDDDQIEVARRIVDRGAVLGTIYLRADYALQARLLGNIGIALAVALPALLAAVVLALRLQRTITGPILAISEVAGEVVEARDYSRRAPRLSDDEVGRLTDAFNRMLAEVERHARELQAALQAAEHEAGVRRTAEAEIRRLNDQLEHRVRERTAELEASMHELALATERAEAANRSKSDFLSSMSHELRTPLNAILGFGHLLSAQAATLSEGKRHDFTQHILRAGKHLLNLIDEILDLARIESSNLMLSLEPVGLDEMLLECRTMIGPAADKRGIRLVMPEAGTLTVTADRTRLRQVLLNLLSNAIKYNREHGAVIVQLQVGASADGSAGGHGDVGSVRLSVQDTGQGLQPEQLALLFQPFNRLGQEAGPIEGTGIGLVVTRRLIELMGGRIDVSSQPGVGSVFSVTLRSASPRADRASALGEVARPAPRGTPAPGPLPLLLYVEDNPANLALVTEIVGLRADLRMLSAPDAQLGLELARLHRPRVILMDLNLPGLSGRDALTILRDDPATRSIPVIAVTANAMPRDVAQGRAAGFSDYVTKPIDVERLNRAIDEALADAPRP